MKHLSIPVMKHLSCITCTQLMSTQLMTQKASSFVLPYPVLKHLLVPGLYF